MKKLITSGCSFSECISSHIDTWPRHLARAMPEYQHISKAMSSQGNALISRSIIYEVNKQLKTNSAEEILVGVVWSGPNRHESYIDIDDMSAKEWKNVDGWIENPTGFIKEYKTWEILNHHWTRPKSQIYYKHFYSEVGDYIQTLENILRTQWFLEKYNIKYFMSTYTNSVFPANVENSKYYECKHLYDEINFKKFLPIEGIKEWCKDNTGLDLSSDNLHPSTEQHKMFVEQVILPFGFK